MKKALIAALILVLIIGGMMGMIAVNNLTLSTGRCLLADNGSVLLILDNSPIVMSSQDGDGLFDGLSTGDEILVLHDGIQESYPGHTGAYYVRLISAGSAADIPAEVMESLTELGWIS